MTNINHTLPKQILEKQVDFELTKYGITPEANKKKAIRYTKCISIF